MKFHPKKAQITLFIVLGLVVLIGLGFFIYLQGITQKVAPVEEFLIEVPLETRPAYTFMKTCIKDAISPGIFGTGLQGGYVFGTNFSLETYYGDTAYGYIDGRNVLPPLSRLRDDLSSFAASAVIGCGKKLNFPEFDISLGDVTISTQILMDKVLFDIDFPITLKQDDSVLTIDKFRSSIPIRLGYVYEVADTIIDEQVQNEDVIDLSLLSSFDVTVDILPHDTEHIVFVITDNSSNLARPFVFVFAAKYVVNDPPSIDLSDLPLENGKPTLVVIENELFSYQVRVFDPDGDDVSFVDDAARFEISDQGIISFIPQIPGRFSAKITVADIKGQTDEAVINFRVTE